MDLSARILPIRTVVAVNILGLTQNTSSRTENVVLEAYSEQANPASLDRAFVLCIGRLLSGEPIQVKHKRNDYVGYEPFDIDSLPNQSIV